ncbi:MAG: hypothetical protein EBS56_06015, partial [Planctomycetia bacterium]|nr:hypothetical protein [Planctomycetia bacterium]
MAFFRHDGSLRGLLAAACLVLAAGVAPAAERQVLLVAAIDGYADLKSQLSWFGRQIDNPGLTPMVEALINLSTQGRGLAGLDLNRPLGIVVTSDGADIAAHAFVPVNDLDKLLASLQAVTGPVTKEGDRRRATLPSGIRLSITERDGWAAVAPAGLEAPPVDPTPLLAAVARDYTLGIEAFPGRMSDGVRRQFEAMVEQGAADAAAQGQPVDGASIGAFLDSLRQTESLALGLAIDDSNGTVFLENRSVALPGSVSAAAVATLAQGTLTVGVPPLAAGNKPAIRGHVAQAIPEQARAGFLTTLDQLLPREAGDPLTRTISRVVYDVLSATLAAGALDAALAVDTTAATKEKPLPAFTAGVRVRDGKALEQQVKKAFGAAGGVLPGVTARFDTGKAGPATLHTVSFDVADEDLAERIGKSLDFTLAVAPDGWTLR